MRRLVAGFSSFLLIALLCLDTVPAEHQQLPEFREQVTVPGGGYAAWRVDAPEGARIGVQAFGDLTEGHVMTAAVWLLRASDSLPFAHNWAAAYWGDSRIHVELDAAGIGPLTVSTAPSSGSGPFIGETLDVPSSGDWYLVGLAVADGDGTATLKLYADVSVDIKRRSMGGGFLFRDIDFVEGTSVIARTAVSARYITDSEVRLSAAHSMFAGFQAHWNHEAPQLSVVLPDGEVLSGETSYSFAAGAPGAYEFRADENLDMSVPCFPGPGVLPLCNVYEIWVFGADVALP